MTREEERRFKELLNRFGELSIEEDRELHDLAEKNLQAIYACAENYFFEA